MLHIVNKSPADRPTLASVLRVGNGGAVLFTEDGIYAALAGNTTEGAVREAMGRFKFYALLPDVEARGMAGRLIEGIETVDYGGFVDLVAEHPNCQSWL